MGREEMMLDKETSREGQEPQVKASQNPAVTARVLVKRARKAMELSPEGQEINRAKGAVSAPSGPIFQG